jgi:hypothetical protein
LISEVEADGISIIHTGHLAAYRARAARSGGRTSESWAASVLHECYKSGIRRHSIGKEDIGRIWAMIRDEDMKYAA